MGLHSVWMRRGALACLIVLMFAAGCCAARAQTQSRNPLLSPQEVEYVQTEDAFVNVLLMGIDFGAPGYRGSYGKDRFEACHADAMLVASLNMSDGSIHLVSLPRDTLIYVPGVRGIYKLNGAVHCGDTLEQGFERACEAASVLLGGVRVDKYCAVDMNTMIRLGDAIGGVDFNMDMLYTGSSGRVYETGMQHLDGVGMTDYMRARKNATVDGHDIGRTGRQRAMMLAVFSKLRSQPELLEEMADLVGSDELNIVTNIGLADIIRIVPAFVEAEPEDIGSHVITGKYRSALSGWNFTFTDQQARAEVIREVYGIEAEPLPYVSLEYCGWLEEAGMMSVRYIESAKGIADYAESCALSEAQQEALAALRAQIDAAVQTFEDAADAMSPVENNRMVVARKTLREMAEALAEEIGYPESINWVAGVPWNEDPRINDYLYMWR